MTKIAILSDTRCPTKASGGHGLGRLAHALASGLLTRGHQVTLFAGPQSEFDGKLVVHATETERALHFVNTYDAIIDLSHAHELSLVHPNAPILNYVVDRECPYHPPNTLVTLAAEIRHFPRAKVLRGGIDLAAIPFFAWADRRADYLAYAAKIIHHKGFDTALKVHQLQSVPVWFVGEKLVGGVQLPQWRPELIGSAFYEFLGQALGLLYPSLAPRGFGGGTAQIEAAACGTPQLVLAQNPSACELVVDGETGFICENAADMADAVQDLRAIRAERCRAWAAEWHDMAAFLSKAEGYIMAVMDGERW